MKTFQEFCLRDIAHSAATSPLNDYRQPTDGQKRAGNFKKGSVRLHGLAISIENPRGSLRSGVDKNGTKWTCTMAHHYGYFKGTVGRDKDHIDCFLGNDCENPQCPVFVINQIDPSTGEFDEHKVMIGFCDFNTAMHGYLSSYSPGWNGIGTIEETTIQDLRTWLSSGATTEPYWRP